MRAKQYTVIASAGGTTYSPAYPIDTWNNPTTIGIGCRLIYGVNSAVYDVQHTFSDPWAINLNLNPVANTSATGIWENNATLTSATATGDTNYAFPPRAIRLAVRAAASARVTMTIQQAGVET